MSTVQRVIGLFRDSPTYGQDRASLISARSVGAAGLILNFVVFVMMAPVLFNPDDSGVSSITENVGFGQLLVLILLGGATAFATLLIPIRLASVFSESRTGNYFDQIVLSGISPLRFLIGKVTSQNLFLGLTLFLLLPYLVLSLTLGGVDPGVVLACLFLLWLYCMTLALVTIWVSLYLTERLAAGLVIIAAGVIGALGFVPMPTQAFVLTPTPALIHHVYAEVPSLNGYISPSFTPVFLSCAGAMSILSVLSLFAIYLGPLYGIIRENSTFGEVVFQGDSKRKSSLRLRQHIQRPSEISFFYENRTEHFRRYEGLMRWGTGLCGVTLVSAGLSALIAYLLSSVMTLSMSGRQWWVYELHTMSLMIHGGGLIIAAFLFSHPRNTTLMRIPFVYGRDVRIGTLDTVCFSIFVIVSAALTALTTFGFERYLAQPAGLTVFPTSMWGNQGRQMDYFRLAIEGNLVICVAGTAVYSLHRYGTLQTWLRTTSLVGALAIWFFLVCLLPFVAGLVVIENIDLQLVLPFSELAPYVAMISPITVIADLFNEMGSRFPRGTTTLPFYTVHTLLIILAIYGTCRGRRKLRESYLSSPAKDVME